MIVNYVLDLEITTGCSYIASYSSDVFNSVNVSKIATANGCSIVTNILK